MLVKTHILLPAVDLHGALLRKVLVHLEGLEEEMWLVAHTLLETLEFGAVEVVCKNRLVVRVSTLVDDNTGTFAWRKATDIGETLEMIGQFSDAQEK